jgi:hypothetical protein
MIKQERQQQMNPANTKVPFTLLANPNGSGAHIIALNSIAQTVVIVINPIHLYPVPMEIIVHVYPDSVDDDVKLTLMNVFLIHVKIQGHVPMESMGLLVLV